MSHAPKNGRFGKINKNFRGNENHKLTYWRFLYLIDGLREKKRK
jgi:hypothetical protein